MNESILEELKFILNYNNSAPYAEELIDKLMATDLDENQENLIYDLVGFAYELGKKEK